MSRRGLRIPGRYERPPQLRAPLGAAGAAAERGIRDGYVAAALARTNARQLDARYARGEIDEHGQPITKDARLVTVATVESASTLERVELVEAGTVRPGGKPATVTIDIIRSGWNTSGTRYYPADVLERDVPKVYPAGTHMYVNHPGQMEAEDRPERSLYDLAAVFLEDPYPVQEGDRTVMRVAARVYSQHRAFLAEAKDDIGVSINGNGDGEYGTREGRSGLILERLTYGKSVDFVTKPGAGGRIVALVEAARHGMPTVESGSLGAWLESRIHLAFTGIADELYGDGRLTREERIAASNAVGDALGAFVTALEKNAPQLYKRDRWAELPDPDSDGDAAGDSDGDAVATREASVDVQRTRIERALSDAYGGRDRYCYVRDFDPDQGVVWFMAAEPDQQGRLWQQAYAPAAGGGVELQGDRTEVRERTVFEPVTAVATAEAGAGDQVATTEGAAGAPQSPDGGSPAGSTADEATTTAKENVMTEKVDDAATREAEAVRTREALELAQYRQAEKAGALLNSKLAESGLPALAQNRVRAQFPATSLPLVEADRSLDVAAFTTVVEAAIKAEGDYAAAILEGAGVGTVTGNGAAQGAGSGIPAGFGAPRAGAGVATQEADSATTEALVTQYKSRGLTEAAARLAAAGRI